jgi:hypothetical protein
VFLFPFGMMSTLPRRPIVLLSYFALRDLGSLLDAVRRSGLAGRAVVCVGSYGVNRRAADAVHEAGFRYAPMLALRNVAPSPLPPTAARRVAAGREAGRSFRDGMRSPLFPVETWQFEELSRGVAGSRPLREIVGTYRGARSVRSRS